MTASKLVMSHGMRGEGNMQRHMDVNTRSERGKIGTAMNHDK
jgi:hypothetical protein